MCSVWSAAHAAVSAGLRGSASVLRRVGSKVTVPWAIRMERFWAATLQVERPYGVAVTTLPSLSAPLVSRGFLRLIAPPLVAAGVTWGPRVQTCTCGCWQCYFYCWLEEVGGSQH